MDVRDVVKVFEYRSFFGEKKRLRAVDGVSFHISKGETLGLIGESGCGKTTVGRMILGLIGLSSGDIVFDSRSISELSKSKDFGRRTGMVFQDPFNSLNPRMIVKDIVSEPLQVHGLLSKTERDSKVLETLEAVGLKSEHLFRYPHEFSGGQRQRVAIARALVTRPEFMVLDEPTSSLDVSVQAQILNLLKQLRNDLGLTYLLISHDLSVVRHIADRIAVMYLGKIVEIANSESIFRSPKHPYSQGLLSSVPIADPKARKREVSLTGELPSPFSPPSGCRFHTRCSHRMPRCTKEEPPMLGGDHQVACFLYEKT